MLLATLKEGGYYLGEVGDGAKVATQLLGLVGIVVEYRCLQPVDK